MIGKAKLIVAEVLHKLNYTQNVKDLSLETQILKGLKTEGFYMIDSFLSKMECEKLRNKTDIFLTKNTDKVKLESNGYDKRVYGIDLHDKDFVIQKVENISDDIFKKFSFILKKNYFYLLGKIESGEKNLGSGSGWHRDSPISNQFKTILYLSDVSDQNGPFQYISKSHRYKSILKTSGFLEKPIKKRRFSNEEIALLVDHKIVDEPTTFTAKQGTLIFVNTRGLHRGAPLKKNNRYALTRYHFAKNNNRFV